MHSMAYNNKNASRACSSTRSSRNSRRQLRQRRRQQRWQRMGEMAAAMIPMAERRQPAAVIRVIVPLKYERALFNNILMSVVGTIQHTHSSSTCVCVCASVSVNKVKNNKAHQTWAVYRASESESSSHLLCRSRSVASALLLSPPPRLHLLQLRLCLYQYL